MSFQDKNKSQGISLLGVIIGIIVVFIIINILYSMFRVVFPTYGTDIYRYGYYGYSHYQRYPDYPSQYKTPPTEKPRASSKFQERFSSKTHSSSFASRFESKFGRSRVSTFRSSGFFGGK